MTHVTGVDIVRLLLLAAIWGGSFIFMRVAAPSLGPVATSFFRVALAGIALLAYLRIINFRLDWRADGKHYFAVGTINSAIPFFLFSFAAQHIPASLSVILNAASPQFGALFGALWLGDRLTPRKLLGLIIGLIGVGLISFRGIPDGTTESYLAMAACLGGAACYGLTGVYLKRRASHLAPVGTAAASQLSAAIALLPVLFVSPIPGPVTSLVVGNVVALALLCSAVAYLLYFRLIKDIGPTGALTVTYLMPAFGILWGALFLGEQVTSVMLGGCLLVVAGTALVLMRSNPKPR